MSPDSESVRTAILNARQALQRGDRQAARDWAMQAVALAPDSEEPWLYLAAVASPRASIYYLQQALRINPDSQAARKGLQWAQERLAPPQVPLALMPEPPPRKQKDEIAAVGPTAAEIPGRSAIDEPKTRPRLHKGPARGIAALATSGTRQADKSKAGRHIPRNLQRFLSHWQNWIGILLVIFFILVALAAPLLSPDNPKSPGPFTKAPGFRSSDREPHAPVLVPPLGTLPGQFDVFHALVWGTRDALSFGLQVAVLTAIVGILFGAIAGYVGGIVNSLMMRITDAFLAFPVIAGVVFLNQLWVSASVAAGGFFDIYHNSWLFTNEDIISPILEFIHSINPLILILILFSWMPYARLTNVVVTTLKQVEFIQAARSIGAKPSRIIFRHLIPNSLAPSTVLVARDVGGMVLLQAAFTFIGLDSSSTWGNILAMGRDWILGPKGGIFAYWWVYIPATLALVLFGIGWNLFGDGLGELLDPRDN